MYSLLHDCRLDTRSCRPAPMAHSYLLGFVTWGYQARIPVGSNICLHGCAYTVFQTVQRHGVYSAAYGTVHYKEPLKSFEIRVGHSPGFGLPSDIAMIVQKASNIHIYTCTRSCILCVLQFSIKKYTCCCWNAFVCVCAQTKYMIML